METKKFYKRWWFILIVIFVVIGIIGSLTEKETDTKDTLVTEDRTEPQIKETKNVESKKQLTEEEVSQTLTQQFDFQRQRYQFYDKYKTNDNDIKVYYDAGAHTSSFFSKLGYKINNWSGVIAFIDIEDESEHLRIESSIGGFFIIYKKYDSLDTKVKSELENFKVGDQVLFSGAVLPDKDTGIKELSLTKKGSMREPEFHVNFTDIRINNYLSLVENEKQKQLELFNEEPVQKVAEKTQTENNLNEENKNKYQKSKITDEEKLINTSHPQEKNEIVEKTKYINKSRFSERIILQINYILGFKGKTISDVLSSYKNEPDNIHVTKAGASEYTYHTPFGEEYIFCSASTSGYKHLLRQVRFKSEYIENEDEIKLTLKDIESYLLGKGFEKNNNSFRKKKGTPYTIITLFENYNSNGKAVGVDLWIYL